MCSSNPEGYSLVPSGQIIERSFYFCWFGLTFVEFLCLWLQWHIDTAMGYFFKTCLHVLNSADVLVWGMLAPIVESLSVFSLPGIPQRPGSTDVWSLYQLMISCMAWDVFVTSRVIAIVIYKASSTEKLFMSSEQTLLFSKSLHETFSMVVISTRKGPKMHLWPSGCVLGCLMSVPHCPLFLALQAEPEVQTLSMYSWG